MTTFRLDAIATTIAAAVALCCVPVVAAAQQAAILGIVADSITGRPLENVTITLDVGGRTSYSTFTDRNGFYQIPGIGAGTYTLRIRRVGYLGHEQIVTLAADEQRRVSVRLGETAMVLQGVVVTAEQAAAAAREPERKVVTPTDIRMVPVPGGSGDLVTYVQTLPGVTTTGDRGGQLFVRGGTPADNLVLVDGIPIYQPFHILGFYSVFPQDLVSGADFYAGGFGARYQGRTASVLDVRLRDGNPLGFRAMASVSPFLTEALAEGPVEGATLLASVRRSLIEETSGTLLGATQPLTFESQLFKVTTTHRSDDRCSLLALHSADRGRLDPEDQESQVSWNNVLFGIRCVTLRRSGQLLEAHWGYTRSGSDAVARGASRLESSIWRVQHDLHATGRIGLIPVEAGYEIYLEAMNYDVSELLSSGTQGRDDVWGAGAYVEPTVPIGSSIEVRPGVALVALPRAAVEPRLRVRWEPFGPSKTALQGSLGLYRQYVVGISDMRDVSSVFVAWMEAPDREPLEALQGMLGWQQRLGGGFRWSVDGYYKRLTGIPVTVWSAVAEFTTRLSRAEGETVGADVRLEYSSTHFSGVVSYGYSRTLYEASQEEFGTWFGEPVQSYHPPHDRRHQINAILSLDVGNFTASARWQFGSGFPFTRPIGFDEAFDFARELYQVESTLGTSRLLLDRPFTGRLPALHRLDVSLGRAFDLPFGQMVLQAGVINAFDRRNMFYYDLFTGRRLDQLPLAPYVSLTLRSLRR
jgi:hypothetical protein